MDNCTRPHDGVGGCLYKTWITFPTYTLFDGSYAVASSYQMMDINIHFYQRLLTSYAVCFGLLLMTFIQILALTPSAKRGLPLFIFNIAAIAFEEMRLISEIVMFTFSGWSSSYFIITQDAAGTGVSNSTTAYAVIVQIVAPLSFMFIQFCLFIQAKAVLSGLQQTHPRLHISIMTTLLSLGVITFLWRIFLSVTNSWSSISITGHWDPTWIEMVADALYAASLGSWSLVFAVQVGIILYRRAKLGGKLQRSEALNILMLTGIESMILPSTFTCSSSTLLSPMGIYTDQAFAVLFCILQFVPTNWLVEPEIIIVPSVCVLIPFGSLWASSMQTYDRHTHTFTKSFLAYRNDVDNDAVATRENRDVAANANAAGRRANSALSSTSFHSTSPHAIHRPTGILDVLTRENPYDNQSPTELVGSPKKTFYTPTAAFRRPAEQV